MTTGSQPLPIGGETRPPLVELCRKKRDGVAAQWHRPEVALVAIHFVVYQRLRVRRPSDKRPTARRSNRPGAVLGRGDQPLATDLRDS